MNRRVLGRAAAAFGGVLCALIISELALRTGGWMYARWRLPAPVTRRSGQVRILCIGDSFTFGIGAPKGMSYPEQLQRRFDSDFPGEVAVVNGGVPGSNSTAVYNRLRRDFDLDHPDIVVVMDGANDNTYFEESDYYRLLEGRAALLPRLDDELSSLRTYKLLRRVAAAGLRKLRDHGVSQTSIAGDPAARSPAAQRALDAVLELAAKSKFREAYAAAREALGNHPDDPALRYQAGFLLLHRLNDPRLAEIEFRRSDAIEPNNTSTMQELFTASRGMGDEEGMREVLSALHRLDPENETVNTLLRYGVPEVQDMGLYRRLVSYNLERVAAFTRSRGALPIFQTYAVLNWPNATIASTAVKLRVALIDDRLLFSGFKDLRIFMVQDGHLNASGYRLMAENAYARLRPYVADRLAGLRPPQGAR